MREPIPTVDLQDRLLDKTYRPPKSAYQKNKTIIAKLSLILILGIIFVGIKVAGGILSNSLLLISNAAHMLADVLGFMIGIASVWYSGRSANKIHSYGFHRAGPIGAVTSVVLLWVLNAFLVYFGIERIKNHRDDPIKGNTMFIVACVGLVINLLMIWILHSATCLKRRQPQPEDMGSPIKVYSRSNSPTKNNREKDGGVRIDMNDFRSRDSKIDKFYDEEVIRRQSLNRPLDDGRQVIHRAREAEIRSESTVSRKKVDQPNLPDHHNINVRATVLHIIGDMLQNVGVIIVSALIWIFPGKVEIADPIATFVFAIIIVGSSFIILKDCIIVLMESSPKGFPYLEFEKQLEAVEGVVAVHDLHIWSLGVGKNAMSVHIFTDEATGPVLKRVNNLSRAYEIFHSTVQMEITQDKQHRHYVDCKHNIH